MSFKNQEKEAVPYKHRDSFVERRKAAFRWDLFSGLMALVIIVSVTICYRNQYEIGEPRLHGFPMWFLLYMAYPFLELVSLFNIIFGTQQSEFMKYVVGGNQMLGLGAINLVSVAILWLLGRFWWLRSFGAKFVNICSNFLGIYLGWGALQIIFYLMVFLWTFGGFESLHQHLKEEEPEKVVIVERVEKSVPESNLAAQSKKTPKKAPPNPAN